MEESLHLPNFTWCPLCMMCEHHRRKLQRGIESHWWYTIWLIRPLPLLLRWIPDKFWILSCYHGGITELCPSFCWATRARPLLFFGLAIVGYRQDMFCKVSTDRICAMVNTHYMVDGHPIHNKDPKIMVIINPILNQWLAPFLMVINHEYWP